MLTVFIFIMYILITSLVISTDWDSLLKLLLILPIITSIMSAAEIEKHKQVLRWEESNDEHKKRLLKRHNAIAKPALKYFAFVTKLVFCVVVIAGFYQWFYKMYSHIIFVVLHSIIVTALLAFNLFIDTFEGKWYNNLNIKIIKDEFVQRKVITMIAFVVIVTANVFIAYLI